MVQVRDKLFSLSGEAILSLHPGSQLVVIANATHGASGQQPRLMKRSWVSWGRTEPLACG
jgi:hypothetical protein